MEHKEYRKLHAEWYDLVSGGIDHRKEIDFLAQRIEVSGEPVLELGSGTGRALIPLLERGFDITGIDTSGDMMDRCRAACKAKGLKAELHEQSMVEFRLPKLFSTVFLASGGLGLFVSDEDIRRTFKSVLAHLKPRGVFIYEFERVPAEDRISNDGRWTGDWRNGPGDVVIAWRDRNRYDPGTHIWERLFVVEKFVSGHLVETEANERTGRYFSVEEAMQFAASAGFVEVKATHWLTEEPPRADSHVVTVQCRKLGKMGG